jgi:RimJ/RimL family protein N-acetyltransferase
VIVATGTAIAVDVAAAAGAGAKPTANRLSSLSMNIRFVLNEPDSFDPAHYERHVKRLMHLVDYTSVWELRAGLRAGKLSAWDVVDESGCKVGWCALRWNYDRYHTPSHHVWGIVNFNERENNRSLAPLGLCMMRFLMAQSQGTPLTASIRPENKASIVIAERLGFQPLGPEKHWINYIYKSAEFSSLNKKCSGLSGAFPTRKKLNLN